MYSVLKWKQTQCDLVAFQRIFSYNISPYLLQQNLQEHKLAGAHFTNMD